MKYVEMLWRIVVKFGLGVAAAFGVVIGIAAILDDSFPWWFRTSMVIALMCVVGSEFSDEKERGKR